MKYYMVNKNSNYFEVVDKIINERKKEIFNFFNVNDIELNFNIYICDSIESLAKNIKIRRYNLHSIQVGLRPGVHSH